MTGASDPKIDTATFASSNLASGTYDSKNRVMQIVFSRTSAVYEWQNVPPDAWESLKAAHSPGSFLHANFGPGEPI